MTRLVLRFDEVNRDDLRTVGGKGANLGELLAAGIKVPPGFCVTTGAFDLFVGSVPELSKLLGEADDLDPDDVDAVRTVGARIRAALVAAPIEDELRAAIASAFAEFDDDDAWAVRSSATLEDLPDASFAGQQDTYLNVRGTDDLLAAVRRCWASLYTDRAILYRRRHGYGSGKAKLSVVVQRMVQSEISGILFTADPISGHRKICSIDASYGLGEAIVSGIVDADNIRVDRRTGREVSRRIGSKQVEIVGLPGGDTEQREVDGARARRPSLTLGQIAELVELADSIEAHYGTPQDIEWGFYGGDLYVLQSRPITTLFPLPAAPGDGLRVYVSFGHVQVMTEPMRPLGMDVIRLAVPIGKPDFEPRALNPYVVSAGHRLWVDMTPALKSHVKRRVPMFLNFVDETMSAIVSSITSRREFQDSPARSAQLGDFARRFGLPMLLRAIANLSWRSQARVRADALAVLQRFEASSRARLDAGTLESVRESIGRCLLVLIPHVMPVVLAGVLSMRMLQRRFGKERVEPLTRGLLGNVTTDMDLELADAADAARGVPELVELLRAEPDSASFDEGRSIDGAAPFFAAWDAFLARYGHRGPGEIDIGRPRWADDPRSLRTSLTGMLADPSLGAHRDKHDALTAAGEAAAEALVAAAGFGRRWWVRRLTQNVRTYMALREHPKFTLMRVFGYARDVLSTIGDELGIDDIWMLTLDEIEAAQTGELTLANAHEIVAARHAERERFFHLRPPRVLTSDGESPPPPPRSDVPAGALAGISASTGVVEGRARVVLDPTSEVLHAGEILVAPFSDPGWTPLFIHASGLVMEVGGLMTHGSVVAREYGIPAVVGVDDATRKITTGQLIRVDGDTGIVEFLEDAP